MNEINNYDEQRALESDTLITNQNIHNLPESTSESGRPKSYFNIISIILILLGVVLLGTMEPFGYPLYATAHFLGSVFCIIIGIIFACVNRRKSKIIKKKNRLSAIAIIIGIFILLAILFAIIFIQIIMRNNQKNLNKDCYKTESSMFICD